jgi:putative endonuclease
MDRMEFGKRGENAAATFLERKGFTILHRNWQCGHEELDIVAESPAALHIVEVKTRKPDSLVAAQMAVSRDKQRHIMSAARAYLKIFKVTKEVQFDIVAVIANGNTCKIEYLPCAFYPIL